MTADMDMVDSPGSREVVGVNPDPPFRIWNVSRLLAERGGGGGLRRALMRG